jgi:hypothetical protein
MKKEEKVPKLKEVLSARAAQLQNSAEMLMDKTRDWQIIKQYLCNRYNDFELSPKQQDKLKRYQYVYNQLVSGKYTEKDVLNQLMNFFGIHLTQAYEDINATKEIFPSFININKRFEIIVEKQILTDARRKCLELGDHKNAAAYSKVIHSLLSLLGDEEDSAGELFEGHSIEATFDPRLLGAPEIDIREVLETINAKRSVKINIDLFDHLGATDIDHEDIK